ncbi:MAG: hypothetical protein A2315_07240 [Ignavibacteria bacterium RIFOXYB2_FULL_35_12]|nr:MAG: hypothetical protein A2058_06005 [Ignavibacteria bacterium GWA2_36_19]OGU52146.1 MAG: hypothetical protein A2006_00475 [Ignavibacteria bacterium GWC2_35_8]OGU57189.1 MAG: hypothetical protein A2X60_13025 [Ignavibacteria bacterium GWF2_35_20]OGU81908.1 MAG: hypothetical protein A2254_01100 [Ignavibacteria bacterium RIFOXYA2_FULL_35_9]OGU90819.1 MAG: hypothetical protein A3K31_12335 [Ignavibacteria bacterium RIFOXYA12_FULL_35_25]OGU91495.1 MAG: hypothetical protein A2492_02565 [Ignavibac
MLEKLTISYKKMNIDDITYKDRSEFLRGFATIIRKNNCSNQDEKTMFSIIGKYFGFEEGFCQKSFEHLMENKYISEMPSVFSNELIAQFFIRDAMNIMAQTQSMSDTALKWLKQTVNANKIDFVVEKID